MSHASITFAIAPEADKFVGAGGGVKSMVFRPTT